VTHSIAKLMNALLSRDG